jgi:Ca2+-binding RTX toxin-like protein
VEITPVESDSPVDTHPVAPIAVEVIQSTHVNASPIITHLSSSAEEVGDAGEHDRVTIAVRFTDIDPYDAHQGVIDWGDGQTTRQAIAPGSGELHASHVYANAGIYNVSVTIIDEHEDEAVASTSAVISGAAVHDGVLQIIGTAGNDRVKLSPRRGGGLKVRANFLAQRSRTFDAAQITMIDIVLGDGDDKARLANRVDIAAVVDGGAGDDRLRAGRGGAVLLGGSGDDRLRGGSDRDLLIGGEGDDRLTSRRGAGTMIDDGPAINRAAVLSAISAWISSGDTDETAGAPINLVDLLQIASTDP